jgi:hypothetical protein
MKDAEPGSGCGCGCFRSHSCPPRPGDFTSPVVKSKKVVMIHFQSTSSVKEWAFAALACCSLAVEASSPKSRAVRHDGDWVTIWGAMPQLTEPGNLPPEGFVCCAPKSPLVAGR